MRMLKYLGDCGRQSDGHMDEDMDMDMDMDGDGLVYT